MLPKRTVPPVPTVLMLPATNKRTQIPAAQGHAQSQECPDLLRSHRLGRKPLQDVVDEGLQRMALLGGEQFASDLEQPVGQAGSAHDLLVPLAADQRLQDVPHVDLQCQGFLEEFIKKKHSDIFRQESYVQ